MDDDDFLYHVVTPSVHPSSLGFLSLAKSGEGIHQDFILLASKRRPCGSGSVQNTHDHDAQGPAGFTVGSVCSIVTRDSYVIALRSVLLTSHPPTEGCNRGEVLCAGFIIQDTKNNMSLVKLFFYFKVALKPLTTPLKIDSFFKIVVVLFLFLQKRPHFL